MRCNKADLFVRRMLNYGRYELQDLVNFTLEAFKPQLPFSENKARFVQYLEQE